MFFLIFVAVYLEYRQGLSWYNNTHNQAVHRFTQEGSGYVITAVLYRDGRQALYVTDKQTFVANGCRHNEELHLCPQPDILLGAAAA